MERLEHKQQINAPKVVEEWQRSCLRFVLTTLLLPSLGQLYRTGGLQVVPQFHCS